MARDPGGSEGRRLAPEGASRYEFLVIEDGTADVHHEGAKIGSLGRGDSFGEMAMVAARIRATLEERRAAL